MIRGASLILIALLFPNFAFPVDDKERSLFDLSFEELMEIQIVNSASGYEQNVRNAPASVSVLHRENWEAMGARSLSEAIQHLPGVHVGKSRSGLIRNKTGIRGISGNNGDQVLIMIDGQPIRYQQESGATLGQRIPLIGIQRIELVRGPGSSIYGADAMGGVINLVTEDTDAWNEYITSRWGGDGSFDLEASKSFQSKDLHGHIAFSYQKSDDDSGKIVNSDLQTIFDAIFDSNASQTPGPSDEHYRIFTASTKLNWQSFEFSAYHWENGDAGVGVGVAETLDPFGTSKASFDHIQLDHQIEEFFGGTLKTNLFYEMQSTGTNLQVFPAGTVLPIGNDGNVDFVNTVNLVEFTEGLRGTPSTDNDSYKASFIFEKETDDGHHLRFETGFQEWMFDTTEWKNFGPGVIDGTQTVIGGALTDVSNTPYVYIPDVNRDVKYVSIQDSFAIAKDLQATIGLRHDHYSDFGNTTNPRVGLTWNRDDELSIKLFAGSAFRAPSFVELYSQNNPVLVGRKDVGAETIETYETAFHFNPKNIEDLNFSMTVFRYEIDDIIVFEADPDSGQQVATNGGKQKAHGYELELNWKPSDEITVSANHYKLSAEDEHGSTIADIPQELSYLGITWNTSSDWRIHLSGRHVSDRHRNLTDPRPPIDDYLWGKLKLEKRDIVPDLSVSVSIDNLFDDDAREPSGVNIPYDLPLHGRRIILESKFEF